MDELVKRLRKEAVYLPEKFSTNAELLDVLMKAADAIEELQKRVPKTPHGRLIDADALKGKIWKARVQYQMLDDTQTADKIMHGIYRVEQILSEAPTIIPAEPAEEGE